jgi:radical SAM peptide maturase (CXXX-repeat target family)
MTRKFEQYQDYLSRLLLAQSDFEGTESIRDVAKTVTFQITDACNLCCTYCYQINKGTRIMSIETAKQFFDLLVEDSYKEDTYTSLSTTPAIVVEFIGGEPFLEIDLIDEITDYVKWKLISENHPWANKVIFSFISNGVLYFDERVQNYLTKNQGTVSFSISLDGCKPLHDMCRVFPDGTGSYDLAEAGCKHYMANYDSKMLTKMTIAPENITWIFDAFKNLYNLGYETIHANCVYEKGWTIEHAKVLYEQLKLVADYILDNDLQDDLEFTMFEEGQFCPQTSEDNQNYCGSTGCMLACDPDGNISPCIRFMKSSLGEEIGDFLLGDIHNGIGIKQEHKDNVELLDSITRRSQSTDECWNCPVSTGCGWCTAYNYQETGSPNKRCTYICWMHRSRSLANVYYWNKVYQKNNEDKIFEMHLEKEHALQIISEEEYNMLLELSKPLK